MHIDEKDKVYLKEIVTANRSSRYFAAFSNNKAGAICMQEMMFEFILN